MDRNKARVTLLSQHDELRQLLERLLALSRASRAGARVELALEEALADLRDSFTRHNALEEKMLEPLLATSGASGPERLWRMLEEHADEHREMIAFLSRPATEIVGEIDDFAELLGAHMDAEERTFLSAQALRPMPDARA